MEENAKKIYLFEKAPIHKVVLTLCVPTIISSLVMVFYGLADSYFVGMLNDPIQNAAVTLSNPMIMLYNAATALFGVGSSSLMSRAMGKKRYDEVRNCSATGIYLSILFGIILSIIYTCFSNPILTILGVDSSTYLVTSDYLFWTVTLGAIPSIFNVTIAYLIRSEGSPFNASIGTMSGCLLNIILDPIFILPFGLNMGVSGAGCATLISNCVASLYFLGYLYIKRKETLVSISFRRLTLSKEMLSRIFAIGIPAMLGNLLTVTSQVIFNNCTAVYGSSAVAAMGIAFRIDTIPLNVSQGMASGVMPVIGYNYSCKNINRMKKTYSFAVISAVLFLLSVTLFYYFYPEIPISLFMNHSEVIEIGSRLLQGLCIALPLYCIDTISVGVFQACGLGKLTLFFTVTRQLFLQIPFILFLDYLFPLYGISYSYFFTEIILALVALFAIRKLFSTI